MRSCTDERACSWPDVAYASPPRPSKLSPFRLRTTAPFGASSQCKYTSGTTIRQDVNHFPRSSVKVESSEIVGATLHVALPWQYHLYTVPFLSLYPVLAYAYFIKYDDWLKSEEWTFLACVSLGLGHALSFLITRWNTGARAWVTTRKVSSIHSGAHFQRLIMASQGTVS